MTVREKDSLRVGSGQTLSNRASSSWTQIRPSTEDSDDDDVVTPAPVTPSLKAQIPSNTTNPFLLRKPIVTSWGGAASAAPVARVPVDANKQLYLPGQAPVVAISTTPPPLMQQLTNSQNKSSSLSLPGQAVKAKATAPSALSQKAPQPDSSHTGQPSNDRFAAQSGKWRVKGYTNHPSVPVDQPKCGPYNSSFRATDPPPVPPPTSYASLTTASSYPHSAYPASIGGPSDSQAQTSSAFTASSNANIGPEFLNYDLSRAMSTQTSGSTAPATSSNTKPRSRRSRRPSSNQKEQAVVAQARAVTPTSGISHRSHQVQPADLSSTQSHAPPTMPGHTQESKVSSGNFTRLLAILIDDKRFGYTDPQLAEFGVPLKPIKDGGFWVDAKDVCDLLQSGPSRIDGPAKVFNFRGKYRHCFLRVSADNKDNYASANLQVSANRTLEVVVESDIPPSARAMVVPSVPHETLTPVSVGRSVSPVRERSLGPLFSPESEKSKRSPLHSPFMPSDEETAGVTFVTSSSRNSSRSKSQQPAHQDSRVHSSHSDAASKTESVSHQSPTMKRRRNQGLATSDEEDTDSLGHTPPPAKRMKSVQVTTEQQP